MDKCIKCSFLKPLKTLYSRDCAVTFNRLFIKQKQIIFGVHNLSSPPPPPPRLFLNTFFKICYASNCIVKILKMQRFVEHISHPQRQVVGAHGMYTKQILMLRVRLLMVILQLQLTCMHSVMYTLYVQDTF